MASDSFRRRSSDKCRIQSIGGGDPAIAHRGQRKTANDKDPLAYFTDVLGRIGSHPAAQLDDLLP